MLSLSLVKALSMNDGMILAKAVAIVRSKYLTLMKPLMVTYHER